MTGQTLKLLFLLKSIVFRMASFYCVQQPNKTTLGGFVTSLLVLNTFISSRNISSPLAETEI